MIDAVIVVRVRCDRPGCTSSRELRLSRAVSVLSIGSAAANAWSSLTLEGWQAARIPPGPEAHAYDPFVQSKGWGQFCESCAEALKRETPTSAR